MKSTPFHSINNHPLFTEDSIVDSDIISFLKDFLDEEQTVTCYTSGSTGIPKQLQVGKSAMLYSARNTVNFFALNRDSVGLLCLPAKYIAGRMMLVRAYVSGMKLHAVEPSLNPLKNVSHPIDFAAFTPAQIVEIIKDENTSHIFSAIKFVIIGGALIDPDLEKKLLHLFSNNLYATYGMTETVSHIALRKLGEDAYTRISQETELGVDNERCLWIQDAHLAAEKLQTNDVINLLDENTFIWLGRRDFVINSGGVKLHPEQIESKIAALGEWANHSFFISKIKDERFGERPVLVVQKSENIPSLSSLVSVLNKTEMPERIEQVVHFIYTESGKLNRLETAKLLSAE